MANIYKLFKNILADSPKKTIGEVQAHNADKSFTVLLPEGNSINVFGLAVPVGRNAFIENGLIVGEAPALALFDVTV